MTQMENIHWTHLLHAKLLDPKPRYYHFISRNDMYQVKDQMTNGGHFILRVLISTNSVTLEKISRKE